MGKRERKISKFTGRWITEQGAGTVEYVIVVLVAIVIGAGLLAFGNQVSGQVTKTGDSISSWFSKANGTGGTGGGNAGGGNSGTDSRIDELKEKNPADWTLDDQKAVAEDIGKKGNSSELYAITIHKSQGLTFDRCTVHTKTFAAGQLYVGLSRCSNIEGLTIFPKMEKNRLHASREVIDFYARMEKKASEGTVQLECPQRFSEQVKAYIADLLEKEKAAEKQAARACSSAGEALPWEREDAPGRDYQSTWNQF